MIIECPNCNTFNDLGDFEDKRAWRCGDDLMFGNMRGGCQLTYETDPKGNTIRHLLAVTEGVTAIGPSDGILYEGPYPTLM